MSAFLLEIGCEEIPARMLPGAIEALRERLSEKLQGAGLPFEGIEAHGTPRRLMASVTGLAEKQADREEIRRGPPLDRAFDPQGNPTKAATGFAHSCGVAVEQLERQTLGKGVYLACRLVEPGLSVREALPPMLDDILTTFPWPKQMRWGTGKMRFVRPIHWLLAVLDGEVVPMETVDGLRSDNQTVGHRFHAPGRQSIRDVAQYREVLGKSRVMLELGERQEKIRKGVAEATARVNGQPVDNEALLEENACLVEWPVPLLGRFDEGFLDIPPEVLITSMKNHQKYFPVVDGAGRLMPCFVAISNLETAEPKVVTAGFERVLRARLSDASFFWNEDRKNPLQSRLEILKKVVFQAQLGTVHEKVERMVRLSTALSKHLPDCSQAAVERAALLCKCDLVSGMVGEFPELQGLMGAYYARHDGEEDAVCRAIGEHYLPQGAADDLPASDEGTVLALADRLDTLTGCFAIGLTPSGNKDPFALRRAALGVIRMVLARRITLPLRPILMAAHAGFASGVLKQGAEETAEGLLDFFYGRLQAHLKADGFDYDLIDAVKSLGGDDLLDAVERVRALARFKRLDGYEALVAANKRIVNIIEKSAGAEGLGAVDEGALREPAEQALQQAISERSARVAELAHRGDYALALETLAGLRQVIDHFFDAVLVNDPDPLIRNNRLALVASVRALFGQVADVSRLVLSR